MSTTYKVRIQGILTNRNKGRATFTVRWVVADKQFRQTFATKALAESYRSKLIVAQREGLAFDVPTGLPEAEARRQNSRTWLEHSMAFIDVKWPHWSAKHRRNTAEALASITLGLLSTRRGAPPDRELRAALFGWAFNAGARRPKGGRGDAPTVPAELRAAMDWLSGHTLHVVDLDDPALLRGVLDALSVRLDGKRAAGSTIARKRTALSSVLRYAVELRLLESNPLARVAWDAPKSDEEVDRRTVVNPKQATALLDAVGKIMPDLKAFFGCIYYSALRPEEVRHLKVTEFERPPKSGGWGWFNLTGASVEVSEGWGDHTGATEDRSLKHRSKKATRRVPVPPQLVKLMDAHLSSHSAGEDGRVFVSRRGPGGRFLMSAGRPVTSSTYGRVWQLAREAALTEAQQASPLARVPYHLRHAAVSLWLNAGVPPTQVAEWAGHSVNVLLRVYATCIDGQEEVAKRRIAEALKGEEEEPGERAGTEPEDPAAPTRIRHDQ